MKNSKNFILSLYEEHGNRMYAGEPVTQLEHAWQCGRLAEKSGASAPLQLASWLHDVGHLLVNGEGTPTLRGEDDAHELVGARLLLPLFGPAVSEPVRLHVLAKRYLVTTRESYSKKLSPDSVRSLEIQGGLMTAPACTNFEMQTFFSDALKLRVWDDLGKKMAWFDVTKNEALSHLEGLIDEVMSDRVTKI
jgi:phosphonate degradation associated HDIG domain protein